MEEVGSNTHRAMLYFPELSRVRLHISGRVRPLRSNTNTFFSFYMFSVTLRKVERMMIIREIMKVSEGMFFLNVLNLMEET